MKAGFMISIGVAIKTWGSRKPQNVKCKTAKEMLLNAQTQFVIASASEAISWDAIILVSKAGDRGGFLAMTVGTENGI